MIMFGYKNIILCPSCNCDVEVKEELLKVQDYFFHFHGYWNYSRCLRCHTLIQIPRISDFELAKSYSTYYTHSKVAKKGKLFNLIKRLRDGYLAKKYNIDLDRSIPIGYYTVHALPFVKNAVDAHDCRHIEKPESKGASLLDFGCGSGKFISFASKLGWNSVGYDLDTKALDVARDLGCRVVNGGVDALKSIPSGSFDYITLSHVIEHVSDPGLLLHECNRILSKNGTLWIETPNGRSIGYCFFKKYWRGIEAPRHIYIFNYKSLIELSQKSGFTDVQILHRGGVVFDVFRQSISAYLGKDAGLLKMFPLIFFAIIIELIGALFKSKAEFVTVKAKKVP